MTPPADHPPLPVAVIQRLFGKPLPRSESAAERLSGFYALPILSSDALSSVAYATEATLGVLILAGSGALELSLPITLGIIALIVIVVFSYRQTIKAYPDGGGSYVVARENLGMWPSLVAAASLLVDYVLTAAVSLMAGTQALTSLLPDLLDFQVPISLALLMVVGWANLRGVRDAGRIFAVPTYAFVVMVALLSLVGFADLIGSHGFSPDPPPLIKAVEPLGLFLILRAFSSGCSAMTGIEAIANGVKIFREPSVKSARTTMLVMGLLLAAMFIVVSGLGYVYGIAPNAKQTVMAQIGIRVFGSGSPLFWGLQISTLLILVFAANTAFADFPRLAGLLAKDRFLPMQLAWIGDRLVFQNGIALLVGASALLIVICQGNTILAVNLYALGVFMAFTLSQGGMVVHWWKLRGAGWLGSLLTNGLGALSTFVVWVVIVVSKFDEGAWTIVIAIPLLVMILAGIGRRYRRVFQALAINSDDHALVTLPQRRDPIGNTSIVWLSAWREPMREAMRYAVKVSDRVIGVWVQSDLDTAEIMRRDWSRCVADDPNLELRILDSPYASLIDPFVEFVTAYEKSFTGESLTIVMPMAVPRRLFDSMLLNQKGANLRLALDAKHSRVFTIVRYYPPV
jgi:hypothetical protein